MSIDRITDKDDGLKRELLAGGEHIPYQLILMNAIEDVRKGIVYHEDGGVTALLALLSVLPDKVYSQLNGLEDEISEYLKLKITLQRVIHKEKRYLPPQTEFKDKWVDGVFFGRESVKADKGKVTFVPVSNIKLHKEFWTEKGAQRDFVYRTLRRIIDILDSEGILWRSRVELVGGEV